MSPILSAQWDLGCLIAHFIKNSKQFVLPEAQIEITYRVEQRFLMPFQNFYLKAAILYYCLIICPLYLLCSLFLINIFFIEI